MRGRLSSGRVAKPSQRLASRKRGGMASPIDTSKTDALESKTNSVALAGTRGRGQRGRPKMSKPLNQAQSTKQEVSLKGRRGRPPKGRANETFETEPQEDVAEISQHAMDLDRAEDGNEDSVEFAAGHGGHEDQQDPGVHEDENDVLVRRQLKETTTKYEKLEARHRDLRDGVAKEAERNYERLKKQTAETTNSRSFTN